MEIGFIGLGKLGSECAGVMAEKHNVTGFDVVDVKLKNIKIVKDIKNTVIGKDFTFIAVQTPHDPIYDGSLPVAHRTSKDFDYTYVIDVLKQLSEINHKSTLVLISTVLPGTVRREFSKYIKSSQFIYNPYLIAMGTVKEDMRNPEMVIIGHDNNEDKVNELILFYKTICNCNRYITGTWDEAESIKIFYNTFISMKLSFVNMILDVAERNGNIDADVVTKALSESTKRLISPMYMKPGMGDGGPCHPRDNIALSSIADKLDLGYDLFKAIMYSREQQAFNLAFELLSYKRPIIILGKSFKPDVEFTDGSYSMLIGCFIKYEKGLCYYDEEPNINGPFTYLLGHRFKFHDYNFSPGSIIVDPWGECPDIENCEVVRYGYNR